ncbi:hypothetical protein RDWZM_001368 [Blomia tropicalis]|uniref:Uncharacterized protein n=1 Tax=Blomia tropicalis TaxID=40697 RepID=A0A9Q0MCZ2_BLOTA|nr:hypothetical protein RDWZM_001368 [Blomia tropicalis]
MGNAEANNDKYKDNDKNFKDETKKIGMREVKVGSPKRKVASVDKGGKSDAHKTNKKLSKKNKKIKKGLSAKNDTNSKKKTKKKKKSCSESASKKTKDSYKTKTEDERSRKRFNEKQNVSIKTKQKDVKWGPKSDGRVNEKSKHSGRKDPSPTVLGNLDLNNTTRRSTCKNKISKVPEVLKKILSRKQNIKESTATVLEKSVISSTSVILTKTENNPLTTPTATNTKKIIDKVKMVKPTMTSLGIVSRKEKSLKSLSTKNVVSNVPAPKHKSDMFVVGEVSRPPKMSVKVKFKVDPSIKSDLAISSLENELLMSGMDSSVNVDENRKELSSLEHSIECSTEEETNPIFKEEFENLYDKLRNLNRAVLILKESYYNLIRSLIKMNKKDNRQSSSESIKSGTKVANMLTSVSDLKSSANISTIKSDNIHTRYLLPLKANKSDISQSEVIVEDRFATARFLDPQTRAETFQCLFNEIAKLNKDLSRLKEFFDSDGDFMIQEYDNSNYRINRTTFDTARQKVTIDFNMRK